MGSGGSNNTAASNTSGLQATFPGGLQCLQQDQEGKGGVIVSSSKHTHAKKSQSSLERPVQPEKQAEAGDGDSVGEDEEDDWMFRTFDKVKAKQNQSKVN